VIFPELCQSHPFLKLALAVLPKGCCCVGLRSVSVLASAVHCTFNLVKLRFYLYLIATLAVWFMIVRAALTYLGG
jgi:hypothetical protein